MSEDDGWDQWDDALDAQEDPAPSECGAPHEQEFIYPGGLADHAGRFGGPRDDTLIFDSKWVSDLKDGLDSEQLAKLEKLSHLMAGTAAANECMLIRFLCARNWNLSDAEKMLRDAMHYLHHLQCDGPV